MEVVNAFQLFKYHDDLTNVLNIVYVKHELYDKSKGNPVSMASNMNGIYIHFIIPSLKENGWGSLTLVETNLCKFPLL